MVKDPFVVTYRRDAGRGLWIGTIRLPREASCTAQGRSISVVQKRIRQELALRLNLDARDAARAVLVADVQLKPAASTALANARRARAKAKTAKQDSLEATAKAARKLVRIGLSIRDAAALLGESPTTVHNAITRPLPRRRRGLSAEEKAARAAFMAILHTRPKTPEIAGIADIIREGRGDR